MKVTIDKQAVCIIIDNEIPKAIGTGFSFLKDNWVITAKHVVIKDDIPRNDILLTFLENKSVKAKVIAVHPELDLALLSYEGETICKNPLMPGYHEFNNSGQLFIVGYSPSHSERSGTTATVNLITNFKTEKREREDTEVLIRFKADFAESGNSGGPILGEGGNVVAVAIQTYNEEDGRHCLATSIRTILKNINFGNNWKKY